MNDQPIADRSLNQQDPSTTELTGSISTALGAVEANLAFELQERLDTPDVNMADHCRRADLALAEYREIIYNRSDTISSRDSSSSGELPFWGHTVKPQSLLAFFEALLGGPLAFRTTGLTHF